MAILTERLFVGVPVRGMAAADLGAWMAGSDLPGSPVPPENLHFTLRFLGDVEAPTRDRLLAELDDTDLGDPFRVIAADLGAFPKQSKAAVVWLDVVEGAADLADLFAAVDRACQEVGFDPEDRPFRPHLTLSRLRPAADVRAFVADASPPRLRIPVTEVVLFRSHLGRGGARYEPIETFSLS